MSRIGSRYHKISNIEKDRLLTYMTGTQGQFTMRGWADKLKVKINVIRNLIYSHNLNYIQLHLSKQNINIILDFMRKNPEKTRSELSAILGISIFSVASMCHRYSLTTRCAYESESDVACWHQYFTLHADASCREIAMALGVSEPTVIKAKLRNQRLNRVEKKSFVQEEKTFTAVIPLASPINTLLAKGW